MNIHLLKIKIIYILFFAMFISGCVSDIKIKNKRDSLAVAYFTVNRIAISTKEYYNNGWISKELKDEIKHELQKANDLLDMSLLIEYSNPIGSSDALEDAEKILTVLKSILEENKR